jgi:GNAT superfamily N-acetyltransferase
VHVEFQRVEWEKLEPWRKQAAREHSDIAPLPSIRWFSAEAHGVMLGCIGLLRVSRTIVRVRGWYVLPQWRGFGVGMFLQESAEDWARERSYLWIESTTRLWEVLERRGWYVIREFSPEIGTKMGKSLSTGGTR